MMQIAVNGSYRVRTTETCELHARLAAICEVTLDRPPEETRGGGHSLLAHLMLDIGMMLGDSAIAIVIIVGGNF